MQIKFETMLLNCLLIGIGGFIGSCARYLLTILISNSIIAIFLANSLGSFLIGLFAVMLKSNLGLSIFLVMGFCGGFTTFSTFSIQAVNFLYYGKIVQMLTYIILSIIVCILCTMLGMKLGNILN